MRILWVTPKWTLPVSDGARVATDRLARAVIRAGADVDVLSICAPWEKIDTEALRTLWKARSVSVLHRPLPEKKWKKMIFYAWQFLCDPSMPITFSTFRPRKLREAARKIIDEGDYDAVLLDALHLGVLFVENGQWRKPGKKNKIILRAHNIERDLWIKAQSSEKRWWKRALLRRQANQVDAIERLIAKNVDGVAAIAPEDLAIFKSWGIDHSVCVPLGMDFSRPLPWPNLENENFLFVGRLDWPPNRDGLEWLLKEVWPSVMMQRPGARLKIVGVGDRGWLAPYASMNGVEVIGPVDSMRDAYASSAFSLAPMFYGSGTRIKVVEAFAMGRPLISTSMGVQGAGVDESMYLRAESAEDWIHHLVTVRADDKTRAKLESAQAKMANAFSESKVGEHAYRWMGSLL